MKAELMFDNIGGGGGVSDAYMYHKYNEALPYTVSIDPTKLYVVFFNNQQYGADIRLYINKGALTEMHKDAGSGNYTYIYQNGTLTLDGTAGYSPHVNVASFDL